MISRHTRPFSITPTERDLADEVSRPANIEVIRGYCHSQIWQTDCDARIMAPTRIDPERIAARIRSARRRLHWLSQRMQADRAAMEQQRDVDRARAENSAPEPPETVAPKRTH